MVQYSESIIWIFWGSAAVTIILSIVMSFIWAAHKNAYTVGNANSDPTSEGSNILDRREKKAWLTLAVFVTGALLVGAFCLLVYYGWLIVKLANQLEK